jgi:hypothetical protein
VIRIDEKIGFLPRPVKVSVEPAIGYLAGASLLINLLDNLLVLPKKWTEPLLSGPLIEKP